MSEPSRGAVPVTADGLGGPGTYEATIPLSDILSGAVINRHRGPGCQSG